MKHRPKEKASLQELASSASTREGQEARIHFLRRVDTLGPDISEGKWNKLFAVCAEASKSARRNIRIYVSSNGFHYDVTTRKASRR
jgi:hypothetical protein